MRYQRHRLGQTGFTILELMIATAVLSTMLLLVTIIMISIGNLYYKGINQARVQDDVHSITDEVSQHLQLSGTATPVYTTSLDGHTHAYCIGDTRYVFILGRQIGTGTDTDMMTPQSRQVLWRDKALAGCPAPGNGFLSSPWLSLLDPSGTELIAPNSRLTSFCISGSVAGSCIPDTSPYTTTVGVAYGAIDLLNNPGNINATCKGNIGDQFCATAFLTTRVAQRLTP
jgi:prepilin-type N-terminal cleavage/methylation domain-containing protein